MANGPIDITAVAGAGSQWTRVPDSALEAGLFARLRAWFVARLPAPDRTSVRMAECGTGTPDADPTPGARLLLFPIRGEALLVRMADRLRRRIGERRWEADPLLLILSRCPHSRLIIDRNTYVEFDPAHATYRAVLDAGPGTRITLETLDFDMIVSFVAQYVDDRLSDAMPLEAVS